MSELMNSRAGASRTGASRTGLSRRKFLRLSASTVGALAVLSVEGAPVVRGEGAMAERALAQGQNDEVVAVLVDVSRCVGCQNCQRACSQANNLHPSPAEWKVLSAQSYTFVERCQANAPQPTQAGAGQVRTVKRQCVHCLHPACVSACTVGAMKRTERGAVVVDSTKCIGCRYCQYACPFGVPKFEWDTALGAVHKCTLCVERLIQGQPPACAAACPSGALKFGRRGDLLQEAHGRLAAHPEHYVNKVYGEDEVGGTTWMYISDAPFDQLGFPTLTATPAPEHAEQVMTRTPLIALSVAALCTGVYSFLGRREKGMPQPAAPTKEKES